MKIILVLILIIIAIICWIGSTSIVSNGKHNRYALIAKSIAYWIGIIFAFLIGLYL